MKTRKNLLWTLGRLILINGILLGFVLNGIMVWGDLEATLFTSGLSADASIRTLNCPVLITDNETSTISATMKNPTGKEMERYLRAFISEGHSTLVREIKTKVPIDPGGKEEVEWTIYPDDAVYQRVIMFRVFVNAKYPYPSLSGNCGVLRVNLPWLTGDQLLTILVGLTLTCMAAGTVMFESSIRTIPGYNQRRLNALYVIAGVLLIGSILAYLGLWLLGLGAMVCAVLTVVVVIARRFGG